MANTDYQVRNAKPAEFKLIGQLMVQVYSQLDGFPKENEQPNYYKILENVGDFISNPETEILVAVSTSGDIDGVVVYFNNMQYYGSGGTAIKEKNAAGFRLLAVNPKTRSLGIGKLLTLSCIEKAKEKNLNQIIIHTTKAMMAAWKMYVSIGFKRSKDLDFMQGKLLIYGFRLIL